MPSFLHFSWNFGIFLLKRACVRAIVYKQRFLVSVWFCFFFFWGGGGKMDMPEFPRSDFRLHVGWRNIKTSVTAMLVAMVYCLIGRNPAFACIGVIFGMGTDMPDSIKNGGNRLFGTLIGGLLSIAVFWVYLHFYPQGGHSMLLAVLLGIATVILILLCQYFWPGGVQPGGVVLCIVLYSTPVETYVSYALNRILDTTIGVIVALLVNYFLPRERVVALWEGFKKRIGAAK